VCGRGREASVSSNRDRSGLRFVGAWAGGRDNVTVVQMTIVVDVVVVVVVVAGGGHGVYGGGGGVWFGEL
jgi:hypothetical protein